ncbi:MAG: hypothetical protein HKN85_02585 [Gammaproteobacteria bacterium]|nr:hypothetical protein [Gammaproteobacteria bacterium]
MSYFIIPALIALALKLYILLVVHHSRASRLFYGMILIFALHNLCEVTAYIQFANGTISEFLLRAYYAITFCLLSYMCLYSIEVSKLEKLKSLMLPLCGWTIVASTMAFATDYLVSGIEPIGYSATAVKGSLYWIFSVTTLGSLIFVVVTLMYGYRHAATSRVQIQCLYTLFAMLPLVLVGFAIIPLMNMGYKINAAGVLPICTTLFLIITLKSESKHRFTDIRRFLPFSPERRTALEVQNIISRYSMDEISYKELTKDFEKIVIKHKLEKAGESVSAAARAMQMKRSTLYSMLDRHGLKK